MTDTPDARYDRRQYLTGIGAGLVALLGFSAPVAAGGGSRLANSPGYFAIYASDAGEDGSEGGDDLNTAEEFGFPDEPFLAAIHPGGDEGLFDASEIRLTPGHNTLHHSFQFFGGFLMEDDPKPYTLVNEGDGTFESRGQTTNFTAPSSETIATRLEVAGLPEELAKLAYVPPFGTLAGDRWRAVGNDRMHVDLDGDTPPAADYAITRVDFYSRSGGPPEHALSLLYVLWKDDPEGPFNPESIPEDASAEAEALIENGRLNQGGQ